MGAFSSRTLLTHEHPIAGFAGLSPTHANDLAPGDAVGPEFVAITMVTAGKAVPNDEAGVVPAVAGSMLLALPESNEAPARNATIEAVSVCVHADWLLGVLRPIWHEPGLVRVLIAERLFPVCRQYLGTMIFEPTDAELAMIREEWAYFDREDLPGGGGLIIRAGALLKILSVLNECLKREDQEGARLPLQPAVWKVAEAVEVAVANGRGIDIAELADMVDMPQARFARMFRDATGLAPRDYIQVRRIQHGSRMLVEDMDTVTEIALRLGYADAAHFCRVFKRIRGISPNEYRRRNAAKLPGDEGVLEVGK